MALSGVFGVEMHVWDLIIISCPDSAGARKGAKGSRKRGVRAFSGTIILDNPHVFLQTFGNLPCIISKSYLNHI